MGGFELLHKLEMIDKLAVRLILLSINLYFFVNDVWLFYLIDLLYLSLLVPYFICNILF